ncbi:helix-turn-helix domain-containing protein [Weeksellaceae bacterium A-14]
MNLNNKILLIIFNLLLLLIDGQNPKNKWQGESYEKIAGLFNSYSENDENALVFVKMYIDKAKKEGDYKKLIRGYEEAIYYNENVDHKLSYADSTIIIAKKYKDNDQISRAYLGKGIIYFYNRRQYKPALNLYLIAFNFSQRSNDEYLKHKIIYHLGTVKSYLGDYTEAALHFEKAAAYYEKNITKHLHPNIKLNNMFGYFNSIYRLSTCYKNLRLYSKEDSLINIGLERLHNTKELSLEYGYFQKGKGIQLLREKRFNESLKHLMISKEILSHHDDYASLTTLYFYLGKLNWSKTDREESLKYLNKVDSMVNKYQFITPEIRSTYIYLINDAKKQGDRNKYQYFTDQLIKVDSVINADFVMLSSKIHREYDSGALLEENKKLERVNHSVLVIVCLCVVVLLVSWSFVWKYQKKAKELDLKYKKLLENYKYPQKANMATDNSPVSSSEKHVYASDIIIEVRGKLRKFEQEKLFLNKNLTVPMVANMIGTNRNLLSYVLNDHLQVTFTMYLKNLRIKYITNLMLQNSKCLNYTVDTLAEMCGMANRKIFATHFTEINGIKPSEFIQKRKEEIKKI